MPIKEIGLTSFRNHNEINLTFCPNINVIWGRNGSGKTAILEAIHILSIGRSFRTNRKTELLTENQEYLSIKGKFEKTDTEQIIRINQTSDGARRIFIDEAKLDNVRQLIGLNPVVLLSPEEQIITKGSPQDQRNYFNKIFSIISSKYLNTLSDYNKIIKQRNKLLTDFHFIESAEQELDVWNERLAEMGMALWKMRKKYLDKFFDCLEIIVDKVNDEKLSFNSEIIVKMSKDKEDYLDKLKDLQKRDIYLGRTGYGPHKDKINFIFNEKLLKQYGSQGEHKLALLLIKLAEVELIKKETNQNPIILLDDLFAKLDDSRSKQVMEMISNDLQTIITTTDIKIVEERGIAIDNKVNCSFYLG